jgi:hypothetical protein
MPSRRIRQTYIVFADTFGSSGPIINGMTMAGQSEHHTGARNWNEIENVILSRST